MFADNPEEKRRFEGLFFEKLESLAQIEIESGNHEKAANLYLTYSSVPNEQRPVSINFFDGTPRFGFRVGIDENVKAQLCKLGEVIIRDTNDPYKIAAYLQKQCHCFNKDSPIRANLFAYFLSYLEGNLGSDELLLTSGTELIQIKSDDYSHALVRQGITEADFYKMLDDYHRNPILDAAKEKIREAAAKGGYMAAGVLCSRLALYYGPDSDGHTELITMMNTFFRKKIESLGEKANHLQIASFFLKFIEKNGQILYDLSIPAKYYKLHFAKYRILENIEEKCRNTDKELFGDDLYMLRIYSLALMHQLAGKKDETSKKELLGYLDFVDRIMRIKYTTGRLRDLVRFYSLLKTKTEYSDHELHKIAEDRCFKAKNEEKKLEFQSMSPLKKAKMWLSEKAEPPLSWLINQCWGALEIFKQFYFNLLSRG